MKVSKGKAAQKAGANHGLSREKLNQRQKFLAEYYRTKETPRVTCVPSKATTNTTTGSAVDKRQTLTYSTEGATEMNFSDLRPEDSLKDPKTQKQVRVTFPCRKRTIRQSSTSARRSSVPIP
jgi:hypothetical protein